MNLEPSAAAAAGWEMKTDLHALFDVGQLPRALFDGLPGMAYLARTDRARTVEIASAGCGELLGRARNEKAFSLASIIHPSQRDEVVELIKEAIAEENPFAVEYRVRHADGGWRTVWDQGRPVRLGQQTLVQGQMLDVTHRVQRENARLDAELQWLLNEKLSALNLVCSGFAHEFSNLIAGIFGSAELVDLDLPEGHPSHDTLKQVLVASNHARDLLQKLRAASQRHPPELKPVRLAPLIEECVQILRTIISAKVELQTQIDAGCPPVNADPAQIHQVILDLCLHAWQGLADRRGRICISLEHDAQISPPAGAHGRSRPGPHVCLTIQDNNSGVDKKAGETVFLPFRVRRTGGKKIGLELFLVREIIQAHRGEIFAESEPGHGMAFRIFLPVAGEVR